VSKIGAAFVPAPLVHQAESDSHEDSPLTGARESAVPPEKSVEERVQDRLASDRSYQADKQQYETWGSIVDELNLIDSVASNGNPDGVVTKDDLLAVAKNPNCDAAARAAAQRLLAHIEIFQILDGAEHDGKIGIHNASRWIADVRNNLQAKEDGARDVVMAELSATPSAQNRPGPQQTDSRTASQQTNTSSQSSASSPTPKPASSPQPGLEGATADLAANSEWLQSEIIRLGKDAAADPSRAASINAEIAVKTNQLQQLTNMQSQLMQMMSNLSKLWSDVAMNSIRNLK
jgi:hypothetical protein